MTHTIDISTNDTILDVYNKLNKKVNANTTIIYSGEEVTNATDINKLKSDTYITYVVTNDSQSQKGDTDEKEVDSQATDSKFIADAAPVPATGDTATGVDTAPVHDVPATGDTAADGDSATDVTDDDSDDNDDSDDSDDSDDDDDDSDDDDSDDNDDSTSDDASEVPDVPGAAAAESINVPKMTQFWNNLAEQKNAA